MGKKGKKKGGSGKKKKGGKKGKKSAEPQMTWREALLAYQINIKDRQLEDIRYELKALDDKNQRHKERNERLLQEQDVYMKMLLKQAKEFEKKLEEEEITEKGEVITVMMDKWEANKEQDKEVVAFKKEIAQKEAEIDREVKNVKYWVQYKDKGQFEHKKQIELLKHELVDMQASFDEMAAHLERTLGQAKQEIEKYTDDTLDKQKFLATEKAMAKMDKNSRQEVLDNDWLKREVEIHKRESDELMEQVEGVERENLAIMSELFECTVDDLKISRNFYLTQFSDNENLDDTGILEMDLAQLSVTGGNRQIVKSGGSENVELEAGERPKSRMVRSIEDKVFGLTPRSGAVVPVTGQEEEEEVTDESDYDGEHEADSDEEDPFNNYFHFDDEEFDDYLQLGPLELKLLSIRGEQMKIHKAHSPTSEEQEAHKYKPYDWPLTKPMIQKATAPQK